MADVQEENPDLWFIPCYVNGFKDSIKAQLRPLRPTALTDAYWQAKEMEEGKPIRKSYLPLFQKFSNTNSYKPPQTGAPTVNKTSEQPNNGPKQRKQGVCWRCGDSWIPGHRCKTIPILNSIADNVGEDEQPPPPTDTEEGSRGYGG